jgi:choline dehydrogenase
MTMRLDSAPDYVIVGALGRPAEVVDDGSSVYGQVHVRCLPGDYDEWSQLIGEGSTWSYADLLPYLIGCEHYAGSDAPIRGNGAPLTVAEMVDAHPPAEAFVDAGEDLGYPRTDLDGEQPDGFGLT